MILAFCKKRVCTKHRRLSAIMILPVFLAILISSVQAIPLPYGYITETTENTPYKQGNALTLGHMIYQRIRPAIHVPDTYREFPRPFADVVSPATGREITSIRHLNPYLFLQNWHKIDSYLPPALAAWPIKARLLERPIGAAMPQPASTTWENLPGQQDLLLYLLAMLGLACVISRRFLAFVRYVLWSLASPILAVFSFFSRLMQKR